MNFDTFWSHISDGGTTPESDKYSVTDDARVHILSPRNGNQKFYISKQTARRWFGYLAVGMDSKKFRRNYSSYFYNVYQSLVNPV